MDRTESKRLWDEITANNKKLNDCPRHFFTEMLASNLVERMRSKLNCQNCGGQISLLALNQYIRGFEAAGRDGNEIWPGWRPLS